MPDGAATSYLTREAAVRWFHAEGITHVTDEYLRKRHCLGTGPAQVKIGKYVYYEPEALRAWLTAEITRAPQSRRRRRAEADGASPP